MLNNVKRASSSYNTNQTTTKTKRIRELFNLEDKIQTSSSKPTKSYNEEVFFKDPLVNINRDQISHLISEVINNSSNTIGRDNIKFKVNINNNFYNASIDFIINNNDKTKQTNTNNIQTNIEDDIKKESPGFSNFFWSIFGYDSSIQQKGNIQSKMVPKDKTELSETGVTNISNPEMFRNSVKSGKSSHNPLESIFIPCLNCNELISYQDTEIHSIKCVKVKEEVIKIESSQYSFHVVDYRLKKLQDHLLNLKSVNSGVYTIKDSHYFSSIFKYIEDALECQRINHSTITALKKIITNVETLIINFKGSISTLILIERAKVIIIQKMKILREDLRKNYDTFQSNQFKSGELAEVKRQSANDLASFKEKILNEKKKIENEKDMIKRKISNFRNTLCKAPCNTISIKDQTQIPVSKNPNNSINSDLEESRVSNFHESSKISPKKTDYSNSEYNTKNFDAQSMENVLNITKNPNVSKKYLLETDDDFDDNNMSNDHNVVNEILSDVEQNCLKTEFSDGTSMSSVNSMNSGFNSDVNSPKNQSRLSFLRQGSKEDKRDSTPNSARDNDLGKVKNSKALYREFVKIFLKIKFEKLDNDHIGQKISQNCVWEEVQKQNIPKDKWKEFILNELKNYKKYEKGKDKKFSTMDVIHEEI